MSIKLPTMKEIHDCLSNITNTISGKFRPRSHSIGINSDLLLKPTYPCTILTSNSESKSFIQEQFEVKARNIIYTHQFHDFYCKNVSPNLNTFIHVDISQNDSEFHKMSIYDDDDFDVTERIIPEYYINKDGIKVGSLNFIFSDSIVDSIRNMRTLSKFQLAYLNNYSKDELKKLIF